MRYISTNSRTSPVSLAEAVGRCVASDGGLFMPESIPTIPSAFFNNMEHMNIREIAYVVATTFFGDDIDAAELKNIVDESFNFDAPLMHTEGNIFILELFHGPTLTFKDYGARFMARILRRIDNKSEIGTRNVLVATTGNTGAAVANGLHGIDGINVTVLYPRGALNRMQQAQFTSLGGNIYPVEVTGTIDDCKRLVSDAIADSQTSEEFRLTGANSINIARLLPQIVAYYYAYAQLRLHECHNATQASYCIPCGNMGNLVAAIMAKRTGLPMGKLIAACNINNNATTLASASPRQVTRTLTPSMDMTAPSNLPRLMHLFGNDFKNISEEIGIESVADTDIARTVTSLRARSSYTIDPHGATAYFSAAKASPASPCVVLATAHPAKNLDSMTRITGSAIELPVQLTRFMSVKRHSHIMAATLPALKRHLATINDKTFQ